MSTPKPLRPSSQFEKDILEVAAYYATCGILTLKKTDPPVRQVGPGRIVRVENPFLDFVGSWTERGGRSIFLEAKLTTRKEDMDYDRLKIGVDKGDGISLEQIENLAMWTNAMAVTGVLWRCESGTFYLPYQLVDRASNLGLRSIRADELRKIAHPLFPFRRLDGKTGLDFVKALRSVYPK